MNVVGAPKETMFKTSGIKSATARLPRSPALDLFCLLQMDALLVPPDALAPKLVHGIRVQAPIHLEQRQLQVGSVRHRRLHLYEYESMCACQYISTYCTCMSMSDVCMSIYLHKGASTYTRTGAPHTSAPVCVYVCVDTSPHRRLPSNARKKHAGKTHVGPARRRRTCALARAHVVPVDAATHASVSSVCVRARMRACMSQRNATRTRPCPACALV